MKTIISRWTGESAQQRDVVTSRPQARTEGHEGHRVGLGAAHGGQQDVVSRRGFDHHHQGDGQERGELMRDDQAHHSHDDITCRSFSIGAESSARSSSLPSVAVLLLTDAGHTQR